MSSAKVHCCCHWLKSQRAGTGVLRATSFQNATGPSFNQETTLTDVVFQADSSGCGVQEAWARAGRKAVRAGSLAVAEPGDWGDAVWVEGVFLFAGRDRHLCGQSGTGSSSHWEDRMELEKGMGLSASASLFSVGFPDSGQACGLCSPPGSFMGMSHQEEAKGLHLGSDRGGEHLYLGYRMSTSLTLRPQVKSNSVEKSTEIH